MPRHQHFINKPQSDWHVFNLSNDINHHGFIGEPGYYAFLPIFDETNNFHINVPSFLFLVSKDSWDVDRNNCVGVNLSLRAIQPNLMYVMKKVIEALGYTLEYNEFDKDPWNKLYVASAKLTLVMSRTLPHWTAYQFLDEFRKLSRAEQENYDTFPINPSVDGCYTYYLTSNGQMKYSDKYRLLKTFRIFFRFIADNDDAGALEFNLDFGEGNIQTGIVKLDGNGRDNRTPEGYYNLHGVKYNGKPVQKGVYVNNGQKVVIK